MKTPDIALIDWPKSYRLIPSKFPPISLFDDIADPEDWELLTRIEARSNPRILDEIGDISLVPVHKRVSGEGASYLMAPFTHISADYPSRFSRGEYGVYYAARNLETAIYETAYHRARFLAASNEAAGWVIEMRALITPIRAKLHQLRAKDHAAALDPFDYASAQALAANLRAQGSNGIAYPSVRRLGGACAAIFWPNLLVPPKQAGHWQYHYNGERIDIVRKLAMHDQGEEVYRLD